MADNDATPVQRSIRGADGRALEYGTILFDNNFDLVRVAKDTLDQMRSKTNSGWGYFQYLSNGRTILLDASRVSATFRNWEGKTLRADDEAIRKGFATRLAEEPNQNASVVDEPVVPNCTWCELYSDELTPAVGVFRDSFHYTSEDVIRFVNLCETCHLLANGGQAGHKIGQYFIK